MADDIRTLVSIYISDTRPQQASLIAAVAKRQRRPVNHSGRIERWCGENSDRNISRALWVNTVGSAFRLDVYQHRNNYSLKHSAGEIVGVLGRYHTAFYETIYEILR